MVTGCSADFPVGSSRLDLPSDYTEVLGTIKARIQQERLSAVMTANSAMVLLYWDIGHMILERQQHSGWGAKIIDRVAGELRDAYPGMKGVFTAKRAAALGYARRRPGSSILNSSP